MHEPPGRVECESIDAAAWRCFSKKLCNLEAAFAMFAAYCNFCWQTRIPGKLGKERPSAAMMAGLIGHVWLFDELFDAALGC